MPREVYELIGVIVVALGSVYGARRVGKSSDNATAAAAQTQRDTAQLAAAGAESSGFTRAQDIIDAAVKTQKQVFDDALSDMRERMADMKKQLDEHTTTIREQAVQLRDQRTEIETLKQGRGEDRETYRRYIRKLLTLLERHQIAFEPPPFFDGSDN